MWRRVGSNALANLLAGVSGTVFQIGLTAIASRSFGPSGFSIWALAFSMAALVPLFSANLSTIVTRRLIESPPLRKAAVMSSGLKLARRLSYGAVLAVTAAALLLQQHSPLVQDSGVGTFALLILLLISSQLWLLLLQPSFGWQYAHEQNWSVTRAIAFARLGGLLGLWLACGLQGEESLWGAALGLLIGTIFGLLGSSLPPKPASDHDSTVDAETASMLPLLKAFAIWSIGSAAIQYGLPALMSLMAPDGFNAFYFAFTLNLIVIGTMGAASSALLAPLMRQRLKGATAQLERLLAWAPLATGLLLVFLLVLIWYALPQVLAVWSARMVSPESVRQPLFWLALQTITRSITVVHAVLLSSAGTPRKMIRPTLVEIGLVTFVALPLGWYFGATAFLAALAVAGLVAALYTAWTTLHLGITSHVSRGRLSMAFVSAQAVALGLWTLVTQ